VRCVGERKERKLAERYRGGASFQGDPLDLEGAIIAIMTITKRGIIGADYPSRSGKREEPLSLALKKQEWFEKINASRKS